MKAVFFLVVGLVLIVGAAVSGNGVYQFVREAARAPGVVSKLTAGGSHPEISFTTAAGETIRYAQNGWIAGYRAGDRVTVLYRPSDPRATASIDAVGAVWSLPIALLFLGLGFCTIVATHLFFSRRG